MLIVPEENRLLVIPEDEWEIEIPGEIRLIEVENMALLGSKQHTEGDTKRWTVNYADWLDNAATIEQIDAQSNSVTCTVGSVQILGHDIVFFLSGGELNERLNVSLTMTDDLGNIKHDTIAFTVIAA